MEKIKKECKSCYGKGHIEVCKTCDNTGIVVTDTMNGGIGGKRCEDCLSWVDTTVLR